MRRGFLILLHAPEIVLAWFDWKCVQYARFLDSSIHPSKHPLEGHIIVHITIRKSHDLRNEIAEELMLIR